MPAVPASRIMKPPHSNLPMGRGIPALALVFPRALRASAMAAFLSGSAAFSQTLTGANSGNWTDPGNWSSAPAFDSTTDLSFYQAGAGNLGNFTGGNLTARSLTFNDDADASVNVRLTTAAANDVPAQLTMIYQESSGSNNTLTIAPGSAGYSTTLNGDLLLRNVSNSAGADVINWGPRTSPAPAGSSSRATTTSAPT
jgi:hypothetical protein